MMMEKFPHGKNASELAKVVAMLLTACRQHVHTITGDSGTEFADHQAIASALKAQLFFTHPYSSWGKGLIENTNKLIRQYIPKRANFDDFSERQIKEIQYKINSRPQRKFKVLFTKRNFLPIFAR